MNNEEETKEFMLTTIDNPYNSKNYFGDIATTSRSIITPYLHREIRGLKISRVIGIAVGGNGSRIVGIAIVPPNKMRPLVTIGTHRQLTTV